MDEITYKVYVKTDELNRITAINSSAFLSSLDGWVEIDSGVGCRYHHAQGNYLPNPIMDDRCIYRYTLEDGKPVERTQDEMDEDYAAIPVPEQTTEELLLEMAADHEYRICLMELGIEESEVV